MSRSRRVDLVHHAGGTVPARLVRPCLVTVHDVQYLVHPEHFSLLKRAYLRRQVPRALRRADRVVVPSRYVAEMVSARLGVDEARVGVVPHGFAPLTSADARAPAGDGPAAGGPFVLYPAVAWPHKNGPAAGGPFVLYPAVAWPHKNHEVLIRMLATGPAGIRLVCTGGPGPQQHRIEALAAELGVSDRVSWLGLVPPARLDELYRSALALTFPSRFEGFGAPVVEAMRLGCPVIAADATALPEVVGDAGLLVSPADVDGWVAAVSTVSDPAERTRLVERGRRRAAHYSAAAAADALVHNWRLTAQR